MAAAAGILANDHAQAVFGEELIVFDSEERLTAIDNDDGHDIATQVSSLRVTQSTEDGLEVECEGNLKCERIGDDTVVATSEHNTNSTTTTAILNQSNVIQFGNDFDVIDEQDLGAIIERMVDRLLDEMFV